MTQDRLPTRCLRVGFAGTPVFAQRALEAIVQAGYTVPCVLTQPDRPAGRGLKLTPSPVKQWAEQAGLQVLQPPSLKLEGRFSEQAQAAHEQLLTYDLDVLVVAAYGLILPPSILDLPRLGCLNIHASLLPRWRGAAPIQRAIQAGDTQTGITIMQMDAGLDTGHIIDMQAIDIAQDDTGATLHDKLAHLGATLIVHTLDQTPNQHLSRETLMQWVSTPQPSDGVTYAAKLTKSEALLDLTQPADVLARQIRAFNPVPGASLMLPHFSEPIKVWQAHALPLDQKKPIDPHPIGYIVSATEQGIDVRTGAGLLRLLELQRPGAKRLPIAEFIKAGFSV